MVSTLPQVEIQALRSDIEKLEASKVSLMDSLREASSTQNFGELVRLGKEIAGVDSEVEKLSGRLARATGEAEVSIKGRLAQELQDLIKSILEPRSEEILTKVREIWSAQPDRKLNAVKLGFDFEHTAPMPTISLEGGFRVVSVKPDGTKAARTRTRYLVDGKELGPKQVIFTFGEKYGQTVAYKDMDGKAIGELLAKIVEGEGLEKVVSGGENGTAPKDNTEE